jgi:Protein of unknown function (DUF3800)
MAIFRAFFDESGKFKDKKVVSFCGLLLPVAKIAEFDNDWNGLLRTYGLAELSMKRALRRKMKLSETVEAKTASERNDILKLFAECIRTHIALGVAIVIDVEAYSNWSVSAKKKFAGGNPNPHYFAFLNALLACTKYIADDDRVSLVCDDDKETALNCYGLYGRVRQIYPGIKQQLVAITFADDTAFPPLQAADFLASLCRLEAMRRWHREYYEYMSSFSGLTADPRVGLEWCVRFFDKERLDELASKSVQRRNPIFDPSGLPVEQKNG